MKTDDGVKMVFDMPDDVREAFMQNLLAEALLSFRGGADANILVNAIDAYINVRLAYVIRQLSDIVHKTKETP